MVGHLWGDPDVDWDGIDDAAAYIGQGLRRWGRVAVSQYKEKYGTVRVYCHLGISMFHQIIWPGYVYCQYKHNWMWVLDIRCGWVFSLLNHLVIPYHKWLYRWYYRRAVKKWPHLREEILDCADYDELLKDL